MWEPPPLGTRAAEPTKCTSAPCPAFAALPLALFLPNNWRKEAAAGGLLKSFPSLAVGTAIATTLSTLDLTGFGRTAHLVAAEQRRRAAEEAKAGKAAGKGGGKGASEDAEGPSAADRAAEKLQSGRGPLDLLRVGGSGAGGSAASPLAQAAAGGAAVLLGGDALPGLLGLSAAELADPCPSPAPEPKPLSANLLPDLYLGNGGLSLSRSPAGVATCGLMAEVANRLAANALPGLAGAAAGEAFGRHARTRQAAGRGLAHRASCG